MREWWQELKSNLTVVAASSFNGEQADRPVLLTFTIANVAPTSLEYPEIVFEDVSLHIVTESDGEVVIEVGRLGPGESVVLEHKAHYRDLIDLAHHAVGSVSSKAFFAVRTQGTPARGRVDMPLAGYNAIIDEVDLHRWLNKTLKAFRVPGPDTTLGELKQKSKVLSESIGEIRETKERIQRLRGLAGHGRQAVLDHSQQAESYLNEVENAIRSLIESLNSGQIERMGIALNHQIERLEQSAKQLDQATERLRAAN